MDEIVSKPPQKTFAERYHEEKLLKKSKKKAQKKLEQEGVSPKTAKRLVKQAVKRIASNKPEKRSAGRGR